MVSTKKEKTKKNVRHFFSRRWLIAYGVIAVVLVVGGFAGYMWYYSTRVFPNIYVASQDLSGLSLPDSGSKLEAQIQTVANATVKLEVNKQSLEIHAADVGLTYDAKTTAINTYAIGRRSSIFPSMSEALVQIFYPRTVDYVISYDAEKLAKLVSDFAAKVDQPEVNAGIKVDNGQVVETSGAKGYRLDQDMAIKQIVSRWKLGSSDQILLERLVVTPLYLAGHTDNAIAQAKKLRQAKIKLSDGTKTYSPSQSELDSWINSEMVHQQIQAGVNAEAVKAWLNKITSQINQDPTESRLTLQNSTVSITVPGQDGRQLDVAKTDANVVKAVQDFIQNNKSDDTITIPAVIIVTKPQVNESNISSLGIVDLIGSGTTSFSGSPQNRVHNITVGAAALNGILIKPGEEFSTLKNLGKIDGASGYLPELVIKENRTEPEFGGGLCQVSTTLFRASMNSGLKITDRRNHSYRVGYYEPPVGMDATIYEGSPDFKFVNDTASNILIQSHVDGTKITFDIYGKKDGRTVQQTAPSVYDVVQPPDPVYVNTDTLPTGTTKQIEKAHAGSNASFTYTVLNADGSERNKQTFVSHYVPWQARYLVGTGPVATP
ncbi:MAG: VanW family protein [Patescibacteria group bacterium]|jgi:vancomycin resistance protein YoaR